MGTPPDPRDLIVELCQQFYGQGWVSWTGGGMSLRDGERIFMAPSGVQKERLTPDDLFELSPGGDVVRAPTGPFTLSACAPLFMNAYELRGAGAVLHSHSASAVLATLSFEREFRVTELEMIKGIRGMGYYDELVVPIIENTAHECDLADSMADAIRQYPKSDAVLVRRHGVYVWGKTWVECKTQAETYDYLFDVAVRMKSLGVDPTAKTNAKGDSR